MLLSAHVTSVLCLVWFNSFVLTTGFYWSYTQVTHPPYVLLLCSGNMASNVCVYLCHKRNCENFSPEDVIDCTCIKFATHQPIMNMGEANAIPLSHIV